MPSGGVWNQRALRSQSTPRPFTVRVVASEPGNRPACAMAHALKGERSADLPVEQPEIFHFIVNLKTAKELGIAVPERGLVGPTR
jgi:ABC-type uncharacterized transport system substrate-binding protein